MSKLPIDGWDDDWNPVVWTVLRRKESGRLWLYPFGIAEMLYERSPEDWEIVITNDDKDGLTRMVALANHDMNQQLRER